MPHPIASIALSLAPFAADLAGKMMNMKKEAKTRKDLNERLEKLEAYEVEQAKLIEELTIKLEHLQKRQKNIVAVMNSMLVVFIVVAVGAIISYFTL